MDLKKEPDGTCKAEEYTIWKENLTRSAKCKNRLCIKKKTRTWRHDNRNYQNLSTEGEDWIKLAEP